MIESFEPRRMFNIAFDPATGVVSVVGTEAADVVTFESRGDTFRSTLNGQSATFDTARVTSLEIRTRGGDDSILLGKKLAIAARIDSGDGNDMVGGSRLNDTIFAAGGNDILDGRSGDDYLDAGDGDDVLTDYHGTNVLHGGTGADVSLQDRGLFGSGVETRRYVAFNADAPGPYDIYTAGENEGTVFKRDGDKLVLKYYSYLASGSYRLTGKTLQTLPTGEKLAGIAIDAPVGGTANVVYFTRTWDVTGSERDGLVFKRVFTQQLTETPGEQTQTTTTRVPLLLPANA
jgi:Ca2+-binding RTX toxin-like protein